MGDCHCTPHGRKLFSIHGCFPPKLVIFLASIHFPSSSFFPQLSYPIQHRKNQWVFFIYKRSFFRLNLIVQNFDFEAFHYVSYCSNTFPHKCFFFPFLISISMIMFSSFLIILKQVICTLACPSSDGSIPYWTQEKSARNKKKPSHGEVEQSLLFHLEHLFAHRINEMGEKHTFLNCSTNC